MSVRSDSGKSLESSIDDRLASISAEVVVTSVVEAFAGAVLVVAETDGGAEAVLDRLQAKYPIIAKMMAIVIPMNAASEGLFFSFGTTIGLGAGFSGVGKDVCRVFTPSAGGGL